MRASVLIGGLVVLAVVLLFLPSIERWWDRAQEPVAVAALVSEDPPESRPTWSNRVERRGWLESAAPAASTERWAIFVSGRGSSSKGSRAAFQTLPTVHSILDERGCTD